MKNGKPGQSTIEYVIIFAIVVGAIIMFARFLTAKGSVHSAVGSLNTAIQSKLK